MLNTATAELSFCVLPATPCPSLTFCTKFPPDVLQVEPCGGGRIEHDSEKKTLRVFGYSVEYGQADHAETARLLRKWYPLYNSIEISNDGY